MAAMGYIVFCIAACVVLYLLAIRPAGNKRVQKIKQEVRYYAHRGLHENTSDAPENTMRAFERAVEAGYGIELDVQLTKDKIPVVFHDEDLERLCGQKKRLEDLKYEELRRYRILGTDQKIPKFSEVLEKIDGKVPLLIEYKMHNTDASVCMYADRILKEYKGSYCIESFHPFVLLWYRHNRPDIVRGILASDYSRVPENERKFSHFLSRHLLFNFFTRPDFIAYDCTAKKCLSVKIVRRLYHSCMAAWTVKSIEQKKENEKDYDWFIFEGFHL